MLSASFKANTVQYKATVLRFNGIIQLLKNRAMEKIIAVVVSHNRKQLLTECIDALRNQTRRPDAILVINNGSKDDTEKWLSSQKDIFFISQPNLGSGGGFNTGIKWAFKNGYSWVWCMDDDGHPSTDALQQLLLHVPNHQCLLNCAVINKHDKQSFVWRTKNYASINDVCEKMIEGIAHPFNGTFIHRSVIEKVGVPNPALFLWGDETEYFYRITRKHKIPVYTVRDSIHYHPASAYSYKQDWPLHTNWKMYYYIRNRFHIHQAKFSLRLLALINYVFFIMAFAASIVFFQKTDRVKKLRFMLWPVKDALSYDFKANPTYIVSRLNNQLPVHMKPTYSLSAMLMSFLRGQSLQRTVVNEA